MDPVPVHPMTGERIEGFQLPFWKESVELALRAHETLPTIALVGWDIALTAEGPVIIEGNSTPGAKSPQITHKKPWGATDFPELYIANMEFATRSSHDKASTRRDVGLRNAV
jgi:glutathione synthase/RimK-type ligase-like ATP-grasp enzyme